MKKAIITRKNFLKQLWIKGFMPILILILVYCSVKILISVFKVNGAERLLMIILLSLTIIFMLANLVGIFLNKVKQKTYDKLSDSIKVKLLFISKYINYITILIFSVVIYKL